MLFTPDETRYNQSMCPRLAYKRVTLKPLGELDRKAWRRIYEHFRDPEIAYLNGTPPNRMPLWLLRRVLKADSARKDRDTFGIFDETDTYIGTIELYDIGAFSATLGIIIGERSHWGRGYGPEAIRALLVYAFETLGLTKVRLNTFADNQRAQRAFRHTGFREIARVNSSNGRVDVQMELSAEDWLHMQASDLEALSPGF